MEIIITEQVVAAYVALFKQKFGANAYLAMQEIHDEMNQGNGSYKLPTEWNDEELAKWAKMDLEWNAAEEGIDIVDEEYAKALFEATLMMGLEEFYI